MYGYRMPEKEQILIAFVMLKITLAPGSSSEQSRHSRFLLNVSGKKQKEKTIYPGSAFGFLKAVCVPSFSDEPEFS
jgi:hypothetical protein